MDEPPKEAELPVQRHRGLFGAAYRRRPVLLLGLLTGLAAVVLAMPAPARADLLLAARAQGLLLGLLLFFALVALSLVWSVGQAFDGRIFLMFNLGGPHPRWLDESMWVITQIGSMAAAFGAALAFFSLDRKRLALEITLGTLTLWLLVESLKALTDRARPFLALEGTRIVGRRETGRSFPSGHTSQIFFMATLAGRLLQLGMGPSLALYLLAALVGFTRIYVGAHYPRDVIGGALLGTVWGLVTALVDPYLFAFGG